MYAKGKHCWSHHLKSVQPFYVNSPYGIALAHNGNLTNAIMLRERLVKEGSIFHTTSDTETIVHLIAQSKKYKIIDGLIIHRVGLLEPTDPIVLVASWSEHRDNAFNATRDIMEALKAQAPFWKKESTTTMSSAISLTLSRQRPIFRSSLKAMITTDI